MAAIFDNNPAENFMPNKQTLMYTIANSAGAMSAASRFIVQVEENSLEIVKLYLTANTSDKAFFDLSAIVRERLDADAQDATDATIFNMSAEVTHSTQATNRYSVKIGIFDGTSESLADATKVVYLVNGTEQIAKGLHPSFAEYYPTGTTKKSWLTERWNDKKVVTANDTINYYFGENDEGVIAWIHDSVAAGGIDTLVNYQLYGPLGTLGSQDTYTIASDGGNSLSSTNYNEKVHYTGLAPASLRFDAANLPSAHPTWNSYIIWLSSSSTKASSYLRVYKDCGISKNEKVQLAYANRLGGWDYMSFNGNAKKVESVERKTYNKTLGSYSNATYSFNSTDRTTKAYHVSAKRKYTLKAQGWRQEEFYQLEGLVQSRQVFMRYGDATSDTANLDDRNIWMPVQVVTSSVTIKDKDAASVALVTFDVELAQDLRC